MKTLSAVLWTEFLKVRRSGVFIGSLLFFLFVGIMMGLIIFLAIHPEIASRSSTMQMKTSFLSAASWMGFYELMMQTVLTIVVIGSGVITSWSFGREFADHTIKDLLALPVQRSAIVSAKFIILAGWSIVLSLVVLFAAILTGLAIHLPGWDTGAFFEFLANYLLCAVLNILLITPIAFVASAGKGYMLPISFVILLMIITQMIFVSVPGIAPWFPWALPALFSGVAGGMFPEPGIMSYFLFIFMVLAGLLGTMTWWKQADHHL